MYSCGGWIADRTRNRERVEIWTLCAGDPPEGPLTLFARTLHTRWKTGREAVAIRRAEDLEACRIVGADPRHFDLPDCIYRRELDTGRAYYRSTADIFGLPDERDAAAVLARCAQEMAGLLDGRMLVIPLGVGDHVDHQLARRLGEGLSVPVAYYTEVPYALDPDRDWRSLLPAGYAAHTPPISEAGFRSWVQSAAAYASQLSTFWKDERDMEAAFAGFLERFGGIPFWLPDSEDF